MPCTVLLAIKLFYFQIKTKLAGKKLESLAEPLISLASDTYTESELAT